jgi:hypothetical protein
MTPLEKVLERHLSDYCREENIIYIKGSAAGKRGFPDRMLIRSGKVLFLELKRKGCKPRPIQRYWMNKLREEGIDAEWTDNYADAVRYIKGVFGA